MICHSCLREAQRAAGNAPLWDNICQTALWSVAHAYNSALLGWLVLIPRRHIIAIDEMTEAESVELGRLLRVVSEALKQTVGCQKTYVMQFAEAAEHPHVHFHVVPRMPDQPDALRGPRIFGYLDHPSLPVVDEVAMNRLAELVREQLLRHPL